MANKRIYTQVLKQLTIITKNLNSNLIKTLEPKLLETYKTNVTLSYSPRALNGNYDPTGTFESSIYTKVEDNEITVMIEDVPYDTPYGEGRSTVDVHKFLTEGTQVSGTEYPYYEDDADNIEFARNYPTPIHYFEEHTVEQMKGFIDSIEADIKKR